MVEDIEGVIRYPYEGEDAVETLLIGSGLHLLASVLASVPLAIGAVLTATGILAIVGVPMMLLAALPYVFVFGYSVRVSRAVLAGQPEPPRFEDWGGLAKDGAYVLAIALVYGLPLLAVAAVGLVVAGLAFLLPDDLTGIVLLLLAVAGAFVSLAYVLAYYYALPAAVVNYARTGRISAAWDVDTLEAVLTDTEYLVAWFVGVVVLFVANTVGGSLVFVLVGFAVYFYAQVAVTYVFTRGVADALEGEPGAAPGAEPTAPGAADSPDDDVAATHAEPPGRDGGSTGDDSTGAPDAADQERPASGATETPDDVGDAAAETTEAGDDDGDAPSAAPGATGAADRDLVDVSGVGPAKADALRDAGFETVADLRAASEADLEAVEGVGASLATRIKADVGDGT